MPFTNINMIMGYWEHLVENILFIQKLNENNLI